MAERQLAHRDGEVLSLREANEKLEAALAGALAGAKVKVKAVVRELCVRVPRWGGSAVHCKRPAVVQSRCSSELASQ